MKTDIIIIGGGSAGMSSAISATKKGAKCLIIEREDKLGGILKQCIHNGFGLKYFKEELTGPEYAGRLADEVVARKIPYMLNTGVTGVQKLKNGLFEVSIISADGVQKLQSNAVILAMGCRERPAASISLCGTRPVGVLTAGSAQKMINIYGKMIGKRVVIIGSGDVGLIMARRLHFEGAKVVGVYEINSIPSGLNRNIVQCLEDYKIPLYLGETAVEVLGKDRVTGVVVAKVNKDYTFDMSTAKTIKCDTVLLSVGLVPENDLVAGKISVSNITGGAIVSDNLETSIEGMFSCGNVLHVHDIVDDVTMESIVAGESAADYVISGKTKGKVYKIETSGAVRYTVPSFIKKGEGFTNIKFRVGKVLKNAKITASDKNGNIIATRDAKILLPAQMEQIMVDRSKIVADIVITAEGK